MFCSHLKAFLLQNRMNILARWLKSHEYTKWNIGNPLAAVLKDLFGLKNGDESIDNAGTHVYH